MRLNCSICHVVATGLQLWGCCLYMTLLPSTAAAQHFASLINFPCDFHFLFLIQVLPCFMHGCEITCTSRAWDSLKALILYVCISDMEETMPICVQSRAEFATRKRCTLFISEDVTHLSTPELCFCFWRWTSCKWSKFSWKERKGKAYM